MLGRRGEFSEGQRLGEEALRLAVEDGRGTLPLIAHGSLGQLYLTKGDWEAAIRVLEAGRALGRASDDRDFSEIMAGDLGFAYGWTGRLAEGLALLEEALKAALQRRARLFESTHARKLSTVYLLAGRLDEARQHAYQALDLARQQKAREIEANALFALAEVHTHASPADVQQAETAYRDALALAEPRGMRPPHRPLQTRPRQALAAHGPARAGAGASHHRNDDVPRDGDDVLAGAGRGRGGGGTGLSSQAG